MEVGLIKEVFLFIGSSIGLVVGFIKIWNYFLRRPKIVVTGNIVLKPSRNKKHFCSLKIAFRLINVGKPTYAALDISLPILGNRMSEMGFFETGLLELGKKPKDITCVIDISRDVVDKFPFDVSIRVFDVNGDYLFKNTETFISNEEHISSNEKQFMYSWFDEK